MSIKIIDRIKKLLRLSEDGSNEHVAEAAAAKAQELIEQHNIQGEMLQDKDDSPTREQPDWQGWLFQNRRIQPWAVNLCTALADANYGRIGIWSSKGVKFCGSRVDYELVKTMYQWIATQLQTMSTENCKGVRENNSYKIGAVSTIRKRLIKAKKDAEARMEVDAMEAEMAGKNELVLFRNAIVTLKSYKGEVDERANKDLGGTWKSGGARSDASAYSKGVVDGNNVSLAGHQLTG